MKLFEIDLAWEPVITARSYRLYRSGSLIYSGSNTTFNDTGLNSGSQYSYSVTSVNSTGESTPSKPLVTYTAEPEFPPTPPTTPTGLEVTVLDDTETHLTWNSVNGEMVYKVYRDGVLVYSPNTNSQLDTDLTPSTSYSYTVSARNSAGESVQSSPVVIVTSAIPLPSTPTNLTPIVVSSIEIDLTWHTVIGVANYRLYRDGNLIYTGTDPAYNDINLSPNTTYSYRVASKNSSGESIQSSPVSATTQFLSTPTGLAAYPISTNEIDLVWNSVIGASKYRIYTGSNVIYFGDTTTFNNTGLTSNTTYYYRVKAVDINNVESSFSPIVSAATYRLYPTPPTNLSASIISSTQINLTWNTVTDATSYILYRGATSIYSSANPYYNDTGLTSNTTYNYTVRAVNPLGQSILSSILSAKTQNIPIPATPTGLIATSVSTSAIDLTWNSVSGASSYNVYRNNILVYSPVTNSQHDTGLVINTTYNYKVEAVNSTGISPQSSIVQGTTLGLAAPTNLSASVISTSEIDLIWNSVVNATSYRLYRNNTLIYSGSNNTFNDTSLSSGTLYSYTASAVNAGGESGMSNVITARTKYSIPVAPTGLAATSVSATQINLTWNTVVGAAFYNVYRLSSGIVYSPSTNSQIDTGLTNDTQYIYSVSAVNNNGMPGGESLVSSTVAATTRLLPPATLTTTYISDIRIDLSWSPVLHVVTYNLYRDGVLISPGTGATTFSDIGRPGGQLYTYTVSAVNANGESTTRSLQVTATSPPVLRVTSIGEIDIDLAWTTTAAVSKYNIYRNGVYITYVGPAVLSYHDLGLTVNTSYQYTIVADLVSGISVSSNIVTAATIPDRALAFNYVGSIHTPNPYTDYGTAKSLGNFGAITVEAWIRVDNNTRLGTDNTLIATRIVGSGQLIYGTNNAYAGTWSLGLSTGEFGYGADGYISKGGFTIGDVNGGKAIIGGTEVQNGSRIDYSDQGYYQWSHLVGQYDGTNMKLWTNGNLDGVLYCPGLTIVNNMSTIIGDAGRYFGYSGIIDEIRVSNIARYTTGFTPTKRFINDSNTVAYWKFNELFGSYVADSSGNKHTVTLVGSPVRVNGVTV
jgi:fibronectin type 3 domain-containing protein